MEIDRLLGYGRALVMSVCAPSTARFGSLTNDTCPYKLAISLSLRSQAFALVEGIFYFFKTSPPLNDAYTNTETSCRYVRAK